MQIVRFVKRSLALAALATLGSSAYAQASASDAANHYWDYNFSPESDNNNLGVQDLGQTTYNLNNSRAGAFTYFTGTGSGSASVDPGSGFNGSNGGFDGADGTANSGANGYAEVSVGSTETLAFTNLGGDPILLDFTTSLAFSPVVSAVGNSFASISSAAGLFFPGYSMYVEYWDDTVNGFSYEDRGGYLDEGSSGQEYFSTYYELGILDGQTVDVTFYAATIETAQAVPTPSSGLTLVAGLGVFGLLRRRRGARETK